MSQYSYDRNSNEIAGIKVTSKNQGATSPALLKSGTGNSTLSSQSKGVNDINDLEVLLAASTAFGAGYYSPARLARMTKNDKVYAVRLLFDAASIK